MGLVSLECDYTPKITLQSNIIANHSDVEIQVKNYSALTTDSNNLFYNSNSKNIYKTMVGESYWYYISLAQYQSASGKGKHSIQANPDFQDLSNRNFHLTDDSPAVDRGINIGYPFDIESNPRPQGNTYDIGAYESPYTQGDVPPEDPELPPPNLLSPAINESVMTNRPTFDWSDVSGATGYTLQVSQSTFFLEFN